PVRPAFTQPEALSSNAAKSATVLASILFITTRAPCRSVIRALGQRAGRRPVSRRRHLEVVHASDVLNDAVASGVPNIDAEGEVGLGLHRGQIRLDWPAPRAIYTPMLLRPAYLSQKLTRPLATKDGGTLRTVLDARTYMLALSKPRERRTQWQHAVELLLAQADVADFSKQVELALFYDAKLDVSKVPAK